MSHVPRLIHPVALAFGVLVLSLGSSGAHAWYYGGHYVHSGHSGHSGHYGHRYGSHGYRGRYGYYPYRPHRYRSAPYRSSRYYDDDYSNSNVVTGGSDDSGGYATASTPSSEEDATTGQEDGWSLLAEGQPRAALRSFASQAQAKPRQGEPKAGYALAAAAAGDLDKGAWAMRRALRVDPDTVHYVVIGDELRPTVDDLLDRYSETDDSDGLFMIAALQYLLRDKQAAGLALDEAIARGDDSASATNLERLIAAE